MPLSLGTVPLKRQLNEHLELTHTLLDPRNVCELQASTFCHRNVVLFCKFLRKICQLFFFLPGQTPDVEMVWTATRAPESTRGAASAPSLTVTFYL